MGKKSLTGAQIENILIDWVSDAMNGCRTRDEVKLNLKLNILQLLIEEASYNQPQLTSVN
jgi:hypothetical protein